MTKKKALMYLVIFIVAVISTAIFNKVYLTNPAEQFADPCKNVLVSACQVYINQSLDEKKYDEVLEIQKVRLNENIKILKFYETKLRDKCLVQMNANEVEESFEKCSIPKNQNRDTLLIFASNFTIQDIITDAKNISYLSTEHLNDKKTAIKALKKAQKVVKRYKFYPLREQALEQLNNRIKEIEK